jgi:hypothetical protein
MECRPARYQDPDPAEDLVWAQEGRLRLDAELPAVNRSPHWNPLRLEIQAIAGSPLPPAIVIASVPSACHPRNPVAGVPR